MKYTFVKLPVGDIEIDHIREMHEELKYEKFVFSKWFPRPALIDKKSGTTHLFSGQKFDNNYFELDNEGWTHDHCIVCSFTICAEKTEYVKDEGYFDTWNWVCKECYELVIEPEDIEAIISQYPKYEK